MGRSWIDDEEYVRVPTWKAMAVIIVLGILIIVLTGCSIPSLPDGVESVPLPTAPPATTQAPVPLPTAPPTTITQAPATTQAPVLQPLDMEVCIDVLTGDTSIYVPEDYDVWCTAVNTTLESLAQQTIGDRNGICADFWAIPDYELIDQLDGPRDQTIGFIDALWSAC